MKNYLIYVILIVAAALRLTSLGYFPYGFTPDEASFGYDAYSILQTGKDQWGNSFPLVLKSFGDYKPPLYSYLSMPFIGSLGLNKVSIRLTNAVFGIGAVFVTYLLAGQLAKLSKLSEKNSNRLQLISAGLLAVSPWHMPMSRGAFEANLTTFFLPLGIYLFIRAFKKEDFLMASAAVFGLNLFSYHSARLITPLIVFSLILLFGDRLKKVSLNTKLISVGIFTVFLVLAAYTLTIGGAQRAKDLSIYNGAAQEAAGERLIALESGVPFYLAKALHNKYVITAERFIENYTQYTSYKFLFNDGPAEETYGMLPGNGVTYWFVAPFLLFALFYLFKRPRDKVFWLILFWIVIAPIPAALTTGPGYAGNRSVIMLPALQLLLAYGAVEFFILISRFLKDDYYKIFKTAYLVIIFISVSVFMEKYFVLSPNQVADGMLFGRLEASVVVDDYFDPNEDILISTSLSEPHMYVAFAQAIDPELYQAYSKNWDMELYDVNWVDQIPEYRLDRYVFKKLEWNRDSALYSNFVGLPDEFPQGVEQKVPIYYPNHEPAVFLVDSDIENYAYNR